MGWGHKKKQASTIFHGKKVHGFPVDSLDIPCKSMVKAPIDTVF